MYEEHGNKSHLCLEKNVRGQKHHREGNTWNLNVIDILDAVGNTFVEIYPEG